MCSLPLILPYGLPSVVYDLHRPRYCALRANLWLAYDLHRPRCRALRAAFGCRYSASLRLPTLGYTFVFPLGQCAIARVFSHLPRRSIVKKLCLLRSASTC